MGEYVARRASARLPMRGQVVVRYPGVDEVFRETVEDIGMAGMFVCGEAPMPPGTLMHFELRPSPHWRVLRGRARVVWVRHESTPEQPTGMGVRFVELDELARRGVRWLIETYQTAGERPFEFWSVPAQFARASTTPGAGDVLATQEIAPVPPEPERKKSWALWAAAAAIVVVAIGWMALADRQPRQPTAVAEAGTTPSAAVVPAPEPATPAVAPTEKPVATETGTDAEAEVATEVAAEPPAPAPAPEPPTPTVTELLNARVAGWSEAWASQDPERYLAFYASSFTPADGMSRSAWANQRRDRLTRPAFIRIEVEGLQILDPEGDRPSTVFTQRYSSNSFEDQVTKSLTWARNGEQWLIVGEQSAP